ncbi:hypothetical protein M407DRAFT_242178, partial [Tulasnella calospora MUT 4182]
YAHPLSHVNHSTHAQADFSPTLTRSWELGTRLQTLLEHPQHHCPPKRSTQSSTSPGASSTPARASNWCK